MSFLGKETFSGVANRLWGNKAKLSYLFVASIFMLFGLLGGREIWTQEHRWAEIVLAMFQRQDFLHPYLEQHRYYDKPLLSYWLIALTAKLLGSLNTLSLRLPSALAGLLSIWAIYFLGLKIKGRELGLLAAWLLLTTYYFVFWARVSSADMLNLAGSLVAVTWYMAKRESPGFLNYATFFMIIAVTCLCKGLVGAIVPFIVVLIDISLQASWKQHVRWSLLLALIPAAILYFLPFWASEYFGGETYNQNGLYLVYRENILRFFQPFDHKGPVYTYFIYLPIYLFPWSLFLIPALLSLKERWNKMSRDEKWVAWSLLFLFLFFTASGSRRSYYILPVVPFGIVFIADWILSPSTRQVSKRVTTAMIGVLTFILLFLAIDLFPAWYYKQFGMNHFVTQLRNEAEKVKPLSQWKFVLLDAESKVNFYLQLAPDTERYGITQNKGSEQTSLAEVWPIVLNKPHNTIFISRKMHQPFLEKYFSHYRVVTLPTFPFNLRKDEGETPIAFIPMQ